MIQPPMLKPGDRVALVAPAGPVDETHIQTALRRCRDLGFEPVPGDAVRSRAGYLAGDDAGRARDLDAAIRGDAAAIWALRGGYGTLRILGRIDLSPLTTRPKAFIGFSDNTAIHLELRARGLVSFHGPHAGFAHFPPTTERVFRAVLMEAGPAGKLPVPETYRPVTLTPGVAEGPLVGGNLAMLAAVCGTPFQPDTRGTILFLEDVGEPPYRIDRTLTQLRLAGLLDDVAGIALGDFTPPKTEAPERAGDSDRPAGGTPDPALGDVLAELLEPLGVPILAGLPFGHERENWTLPVGARARLDASAAAMEILEPTTRAMPS